MTITIDNSPKMRRIFQSVSDLRRSSFEGCRVLDLGCAHGSYAIEFARRGAIALGIEGRESWIEIAENKKQAMGVRNATFVKDDCRHLSVEKYGTFDIVLCLGLLYHLDNPDVFELLSRIFRACTDFAIIDTHISLNPTLETMWRGNRYFGMRYREHNASDSSQAKARSLGSSLDDEFSFWLSKPSLLNVLRAVGFTSVLEVHNPVGVIYENDQFKIEQDRITLVAMKGKAIGAFLGQSKKYADETEDWPEDPSQFRVVRPWSKLQVDGE